MRPCRCATGCPCTESTASIAAVTAAHGDELAQPHDGDDALEVEHHPQLDLDGRDLLAVDQQVDVWSVRPDDAVGGEDDDLLAARHGERAFRGAGQVGVLAPRGDERGSKIEPEEPVDDGGNLAVDGPERRAAEAGQVTECRPGHIALVEPVGEGLGTVDACGVLEQERSREQRPPSGLDNGHRSTSKRACVPRSACGSSRTTHVGDERPAGDRTIAAARSTPGRATACT